MSKVNFSYDEMVVKDIVIKLSSIYVHSDSMTTHSMSQMTHFFVFMGPWTPRCKILVKTLMISIKSDDPTPWLARVSLIQERTKTVIV